MTWLPSAFYARVFALVTAALLGAALFKILEPFIGAILWSVLLAFLLFPLNKRLRRAFRGSRVAAAMGLTLGVILILIGPALFLAFMFTTQASDLIVQLQAAADRYHMVRLSDVLRLPVIERLIRWAESVAPITAEQIETWFLNAAKAFLALLVSGGGVVVVEALSTLIGLVMMLFLLFFFLRDGEEMVERTLVLVPMGTEQKWRLIEHLSAVTRAVVFGSLVTALAQGTLVGIAFALVGLPSPVFFGGLAVLAALVPIVGSTLVWVPGAGVLTFHGRWGAALFVVLWGAVVISMVDNIIRPLFISGRAQISTLPVFLGLVGGLAAFGPIGMVLGPVIVALALALFRFAEESHAAS
ncbi:MAG TPA: AI-2E family transporter [Candidatus Methylomirabilis sp.]|nr:AI-2E family transporter [Candidatus Methylomirabilis sp.]